MMEYNEKKNRSNGLSEMFKNPRSLTETEIKSIFQKNRSNGLSEMFKNPRSLTETEIKSIFQKNRSQPVDVPVPYPLELSPVDVDYTPMPPRDLTEEDVALMREKYDGK